MFVFSQLQLFMYQGGPVLWVIAGLTFIMWACIFERLWYFKWHMKYDLQAIERQWQERCEHHSWAAHKIRLRLLSKMTSLLRKHLTLITGFVMVCPLLGLLGTVTGMIDVFHVLAINGAADPRQLASGISRATLPTMAGLVVALSGLLGNRWVQQIAQRQEHLLADHLTFDEGRAAK